MNNESRGNTQRNGSWHRSVELHCLFCCHFSSKLTLTLWCVKGIFPLSSLFSPCSINCQLADLSRTSGKHRSSAAVLQLDCRFFEKWGIFFVRKSGRKKDQHCANRQEEGGSSATTWQIAVIKSHLCLSCSFILITHQRRESMAVIWRIVFHLFTLGRLQYSSRSVKPPAYEHGSF